MWHNLLLVCNIVRIFPIWILLELTRHNDERVIKDLKAWKQWKEIPFSSNFMVFLYLMSLYKEFRNIVYKRMGKWNYMVKWLCLPLPSLYIHCNDIGGGLLIQHGFSTIITAQKIGSNVKIFQQVTVGFKGDKWPVIGNNVEICCGAKVLGGIYVGDNAIIGANAVVIKDVPENAVMGGVPAKQIK